VAIFPKWKNIQKLSCFMCISISRPNQGKLTDNNSDSGLCSYVEPYRSLQWRRKIPQNTLKRLKTQQNAAKRCEMPQNTAKRRQTTQNEANALEVVAKFTAKRQKTTQNAANALEVIAKSPQNAAKIQIT
jgi:hypothetical protein